MTTRIALDAMGGDQAPRETVRGALEATLADPDLEVVLVGDQKDIERELAHSGMTPQRVSITHASQNIGCDESPVKAIRAKPDASIVRAFELVARGEASGLVAAGSTGAAVAAAHFILRLIPGVERAGIAVTFPTRQGGHTVMCDVGANISCKPIHLRDYGIMAAAYAKHVMGRDVPRIGLLNVGSEEAKGNELVKETHKVFADARGEFAFIGNVEGNDIFDGSVDVVVCEGFAGNVVLKAAEGLYEAFSGLMHDLLSETKAAGDARVTLAVGEFLARFKSRMDYAEYGGAPLLGVNGLCMISHGRSDARAIKNALLLAARFTRNRVLDHIHRGLGAA